VSPTVHTLESLHVVPFALAGFEHVPVAGLHVPASWHWSLAEHVTGLLPTQTPAAQVSVCVHASPSTHVEPSALAGFEQLPVEVSQVPASWHVSLAVHVTALLPTQVPARQASLWVQAFPSLQPVPLGAATSEHVPVPVSQVAT
jgi:hypothetical protein